MGDDQAMVTGRLAELQSHLRMAQENCRSLCDALNDLTPTMNKTLQEQIVPLCRLLEESQSQVLAIQQSLLRSSSEP